MTVQGYNKDEETYRPPKPFILLLSSLPGTKQARGRQLGRGTEGVDADAPGGGASSDENEEDISDIQDSCASSSFPWSSMQLQMRVHGSSFNRQTRDAELILSGSTFPSPLPHPVNSHQPHRQNSSN
jgi:hypothetical protein